MGGLTEYVPADQLVDPPDSVSAWVEALETLEDPRRWAHARVAGIEAARAVVRSPPAERIEAVLLDAAAAAAERVPGVA